MSQKLKKKKKSTKKNKQDYTKYTRYLMWFLIASVIISIITSEINKKGNLEPTISEVVESIKAGEILSLTVRGKGVDVVYTNEKTGSLKKDSVASFDDTLINLGVTSEQLASVSYSVKSETGFGFWFRSFLPFLFPILLIGIFLWFMFRQSKGSGMQVFNFGRSRARLVDPKDLKNVVTFKDVAGAEEAKEELQEFVDFLKKPEKFLRVGAKVPKGVLLTGAPGTGKTLLARAVAGEASVPFFTISGSEFVEMFVGVGASRVRDLFATAKKTSPAIVFIDEIDAVGRARGSGLGGGNDEREQALNQILVEMDGFEKTDKVVVLASTNRPDILDNALLRPGRFDRKVIVGLPDIKERIGILKVHVRGKELDKKVNLESIARKTPGFSGADLASVVNEAAIFAVRSDRKVIFQNDLSRSIDKVMMGPERKNYVITKEEKKRIAYHEAGHALLASLLPYVDPVQKITIVQRGHAGGYVMSLPDLERKLKTKKEFMDNISMALGGYVSEELVFGDISTGPSSDLEYVSQIARSMVTRFGMSDKIGPVLVRRREAGAFAGNIEEHSEKLEEIIDEEINKVIHTGYIEAKKLIKKHKKVLDVIVKKLFEVETLEREEYEKLLSDNNVTITNAFHGDSEIFGGVVNPA